MGGTDRMDQNIAQYRASIRSKKWWWPLFIYGLEMMVQNGWLLNRSTHNEQRDLLGFRRYIVQVYLLRYQNLPKLGRPLDSTPNDGRVPQEVRYDNIGHIIAPTGNRRPRCAQCNARPSTECIKCKVGLCVRCFAAYHIK